MSNKKVDSQQLKSLVEAMDDDKTGTISWADNDTSNKTHNSNNNSNNANRTNNTYHYY